MTKENFIEKWIGCIRNRSIEEIKELSVSMEIDLQSVLKALLIHNVVEPKGKFYCKKGTCTEEEQCNHCWNVEHPFSQTIQ